MPLTTADYTDGLTNLLWDGDGKKLLATLWRKGLLGEPIIAAIAKRFLVPSDYTEFKKNPSSVSGRTLLEEKIFSKIFKKPFIKPDPKVRSWSQFFGLEFFEDPDQDFLQVLAALRYLIIKDDDAFLLYFYDDIDSHSWIERASSLYHIANKNPGKRFTVVTMHQEVETLQKSVKTFLKHFQNWLDTANLQKISLRFENYLDTVLVRLKNMLEECESILRVLRTDPKYTGETQRFLAYEAEEKERKRIQEKLRMEEQRAAEERANRIRLANIAASAAVAITRRRSSRSRRRLPSGTYLNSCNNCQYSHDNRLTCLCQNKNGQFINTSTLVFPNHSYRDISNENVSFGRSEAKPQKKNIAPPLQNAFSFLQPGVS